jgi:hypothetical protein
MITDLPAWSLFVSRVDLFVGHQGHDEKHQSNRFAHQASFDN